MGPDDYAVDTAYHVDELSELSRQISV
jgi:hypothetical protein